MNRNHLLYALPPLALAASCSEHPQEPTRPNILLIVADDLGMGDLGAYGGTAIQTPHIDSLATRGIRFENGYATSATSTPSRYAMFTGLYPWRNADAKILPGDAPLLIPTDIPTLPKMMQAAGRFPRDWTAASIWTPCSARRIRHARIWCSKRRASWPTAVGNMR